MLPRARLVSGLHLAGVASLHLAGRLDLSQSKDVSTLAAPLVSRDIVTVNVAQPLAILLVSASNRTTSEVPCQNSVMVRAVTTATAFFVLVLTAVTYGVLIVYSAPLSRACAIPRKFLEENIAEILKASWPGTTQSATAKFHLLPPPLTLLAEHPAEEFKVYTKSQLGPRKLRRSRVSKLWEFKHKAHRLLGYREICTRHKDDVFRLAFVQGYPVFIPISSPVMRNIVQISVWQWVGVWLILAAIINTLVFNGFATRNTTPDMWLRLSLVLIYGVAVVVHPRYMYFKICRVPTSVVFQATWSTVLNNYAVGIDETYSRAYPRQIRGGIGPLSVTFPPERSGNLKPRLFHTFEDNLMGERIVKRIVEDMFSITAPHVKYRLVYVEIKHMRGGGIFHALDADATNSDWPIFKELDSSRSIVSSMSHISTAAHFSETLHRLREQSLYMSPDLSGSFDQFSFLSTRKEPSVFGVQNVRVTARRLLRAMSPKQCLLGVFFAIALPFLPMDGSRLRTEYYQSVVQVKLNGATIIINRGSVTQVPDSSSAAPQSSVSQSPEPSPSPAKDQMEARPSPTISSTGTAGKTTMVGQENNGGPDRENCELNIAKTPAARGQSSSSQSLV